MGEGAHVTRTLNVVLTSQRVHAHTQAADIACRHRQIGHGHDHSRALRVLSHTEAIVNRTVAGGGESPRRAAHRLGIHAGDLGECLGAVFGQADEVEPGSKGRLITALVDKVVVHEAFGGHHM